MDAVSTLLDQLKSEGLTRGNLRGFFHALIARKISSSEGKVVSTGLTWRELASAMKKIRWDPDQVRELGLDPDDLPPRDRQRFWYTAITTARVDTPQAIEAGERFAEMLRGLGYAVSPGPKSGTSPAP